MTEWKAITEENGGEFKVGDKIQRTGAPSSTGTVTAVTQRTVYVKWDANGKKASFAKKAGHVKKTGGSSTEVKVGDKVRVTKDNGGSPQVGDVGTVTSASGDNIIAKFETPGREHGSWSGTLGEHLEKVEEVKEDKQDKPEKSDDEKTSDITDDLYGLLQLKQKLESKIDSEVDGELKELRDAVKRTRTLEVKVGDKKHEVEGLKHKQLEQLITYAALRLSPLLVGMAGTGKTHAGEQVATALGLDFYSMSVGAQTSKSDIIGYMDASGNYVETHFRKAYENGGVFLMDEIDAGNSNVLIQINAALSNGMCAFPDKMVKKHEDFIFIASANTFGNGANRQYVGRNQLDAATLDRFAFIEWTIDDALEESLSIGLNGKAWYTAVRAARDYVAEKNIRALISPRATQKGSKLLDAGQQVDEVIEATMLASVPEDKRGDVKQVATTIFEKLASDVPSQIDDLII